MKHCLAVLLMVFSNCFSVFGQTEDLQVTQFDSLKLILRELRISTLAMLSKREYKKVIRIKDSFSLDPSFDVYTRSSKKLIVINKGCSDLIVKDIVSDIISVPQLNYVPGFHNLYMRIYPALAPSITPEVAAELSEEEKARYNRNIKKLKTFYTKYRSYAEFIYLHEISHILNSYEKQYKQVMSKYQRGRITRETKDSLLTSFEIAADDFAITILHKLNKKPEQSFGVYRLFYFYKERLLNHITSILTRANNFYYTIAVINNCHKEPDTQINSKCDSLFSKISELLLFEVFYPKFDANSFKSNIDSLKQVKVSPANSIWFGNYFLLGTTYNLKNVEVAYLYFNNIDLTPEDITALSSTKEIGGDNDLKSYEYVQYCAGKICELYFRDSSKAIQHYKNAKIVSLLMSEEYYLRAINSIKNSNNNKTLSRTNGQDALFINLSKTHNFYNQIKSIFYGNF